MQAWNSRNRGSNTSAILGRRLSVIDRCRDQATRTLAFPNPRPVRLQDNEECKMSIADIGLTPDSSFMAALPPIRLEQPEIDVKKIDLKSARLKLLLDLTNSVVPHLELGDLLKKVSVSARRVVPSEFAVAGLLDSRTGRLSANAFDFPDGDSIDEAAGVLLGEILAERVFTTGKPWVGNTEELAEADPAQNPSWAALGLSNICALPLVSRDH